MRKIVLDSNVFILFFAGNINPDRIGHYTRKKKDRKNNLGWNIDDYNFLLNKLGNDYKIITSPNVSTEVDNILNGIEGEDKLKYLNFAEKIYSDSIEEYIESKSVFCNNYDTDYYLLYELGLSDFVVLEIAKKSDLLISADSKLCDRAKSLDINVVDFKEYKQFELHS
ncbi:MAG: hypothetical protein FWF51_04435 [Chitinivibrionia bacterium]|nr:hypothetical protein [Chitinivibrionia bacterium]